MKNSEWLTESDIYRLHKQGTSNYPINAKLTPAAKDLIRKYGMKPGNSGAALRIAIASDHGGYERKIELIKFLAESGYIIEDLGCHSKDSVDYPDYAAATARRVAAGQVDFGIMIDTIGIASAMAANKIRGIRAAFCPDVETSKSARGHNDANILTIGGKMEAGTARDVVLAFLREPFLGGRHKSRVDKITALER